MQELEITWPRIVSVWWLIAWRTLLGGGIIAFALAFLIGAVGARLGFDFQPVVIVSTVVAWLTGLIWGLFVVRMALKKNYEEFRLALMKKS
ncbi:MAG TPA: hypothetical protein VKT73_14110 [Xanthobacteraceae bacterium]|nr:hypothetical protein [Xanthobacteraceae bacterium]